jgi:glycosyltransferase involved in cell wall biosynthesis
MRILFLHQNFPGQFVHVAQALRRSGRHELLALVPDGHDRPSPVPTRAYAFDAGRVRTGVPLAHHYTRRVARGAAVATAMAALRAEGYQPDLVIGHGGWGETLFVKDVWPAARVILHAEFFYAAEGSDVGFDPEFPEPDPVQARLQIRTRNTAMTQALLDADQGVAPTGWQASRFPPGLRERIAVVHEGIDTDGIRPDPAASVSLRQDGVVLRPGDEVVTYVARNLEPYRGFHVFMRALPLILQARPQARAVIVGGDEVSYGRSARGGRSWREVLLNEVRDRLDPARVHFVSRVPHPVFVQLMQVSAAHVYLTYPFVLSWSVLEAMSAGALVVGSRTPPVEEVVEDGRNGILRGFHDVAGIADAVVEALAYPEAFRSLRAAARRTVVERFDLRRVCLPQWLALVHQSAA